MQMALAGENAMNQQDNTKIVEICDGIDKLIDNNNIEIELAKRLLRKIFGIVHRLYVARNLEIPEEIIAAMTRVNTKLNRVN
jgi:hypothetical protein